MPTNVMGTKPWFQFVRNGFESSHTKTRVCGRLTPVHSSQPQAASRKPGAAHGTSPHPGTRPVCAKLGWATSASRGPLAGFLHTHTHTHIYIYIYIHTFLSVRQTAEDGLGKLRESLFRRFDSGETGTVVATVCQGFQG